METDKKKEKVKFWIMISSILIILIIIIAIMIKYEVEGDKNMPFELSKIVMVSTAEGVESEGKSKWNFRVFQNNDLYFYINKNEEYFGNETVIESVSIENIKITRLPEVGKIEMYMPNSMDGRLYSYSNEYIVKEGLTYRGASESNSQTLEIGNQGGCALIRFCNTELGEYKSNKDAQIVHDGTLLRKLSIKEEQLKFQVSFDLIIKVTKGKYKANIVLDLPYGDIMEEGTTSIEKTDMNDIIFKRIK